jgi:hypothetical protein
MVKVMNDDLCQFWKEVDTRRKRVSLSQLAKKINVPRGTLFSWRKRNRIDRYYFTDLTTKLDNWKITEDEATRMGLHFTDRGPSQKEPGPHQFGDNLLKASQLYNHEFKEHFKRYARNTAQVINTLGDDCFFAFCSSTTIPHEFMRRSYDDILDEREAQGREIGYAIGRALLNGALCLYIRPDKERVAYYEGWNFKDLVSYEGSFDQIGHFRARVKDWLTDGRFGYPLDEAEADEILYGRLQQCYINDAPMWMPGVGLSMVGRLDDKHLTTRMAISLPGGEFGGVLLYPHYPLFEHRFREFVGKVVSDARAEVQARKKGRSGRKIKIDSNNDYIGLMETFYSQFDRLIRGVPGTEPAKPIKK